MQHQRTLPPAHLQGHHLLSPCALQFSKMGYTAPTFIQAQAWPIAMTGRDLVAIASTGSGKTCGFLIPAFLKIKQQLADSGGKAAYNGPHAVVLAPTRELAQQIAVEAHK